MSDELRDRIAKTIRSANTRWDSGRGLDTKSNHAAQAIIDDLGLHWSDDGAWLVPNEYEQMVPRALRVVGRWETIE